MKLETLTLVDTCELQRWAEEKHGMSSNDWHKKIWNSEKGFLYYMEGGPYCRFSKIESPQNLFEEHLNEFLDDFPELGGSVSFIFTN